MIATGADSRWLGVPGEWEYRGAGISACATCDGFMFSDKPVVVIGGGDTAMEDALVLARTSSSVVVVHRRDSFRASHVLAERVLNHPKIKVLWNTEVASFAGRRVKVLPNGLTAELGADGELLEDELGKLRVKELRARLDLAAVDTASVKDKDELVRLLRDVLREGVGQAVEERNVLTEVRIRTAGGEERGLEVSGAFVAIGHDPNTKFLQGHLQMHPDGYLVTAAGTTRTSVEAVFAAGDVADRVYRQAITSAGSGAAAALDAERWLSEHGFCAGCAQVPVEAVPAGAML